MRSEMIRSLLDQAAAADGSVRAGPHASTQLQTETRAEESSVTVASATVKALNALFAELRPLIGSLALRALYVRGLHLAHASFERPSADLASTDQLLAHLHQDLVSRQAAPAREAAQALLLALVNLLVSLIGEPLTDRLLRKAWENLPVTQASKVKPL